MEIWKDIKDSNGAYQVSNLGRIRSKTRYVKNSGSYSGVSKKSGIFLKQTTTKKGYKRLGLVFSGKRKSFQVHRIVALHFIPNPENKPQVNHINSIKTDNRVENLEWVNNSENIQHAYDNNKISRPMSKEVVCVKTNKKYKTILDATKDSIYCQSYISQMLNGVRRNRTSLRFVE